MDFKLLKNGNWFSINLYFKPYWFKKYGTIRNILNSYIKLNINKEKICFIQIGTNNEIGPPIGELINNNWNCLLVEPDYEIYLNLLKKYYNNNYKIENSAISEKNEEAIFYSVQPNSDLPTWVTQLNSLKKNNSDWLKDTYKNVVINGEKINTITFEDLCNKYQIKDINILQIDTEGYDYKILNSINFRGKNIDIIIYEHRHLSEKECRNARKLLSSNHYNLFSDKFDTIAFNDKKVFKYLID